MTRSRASRLSVRALLVSALLLTTALPVSAANQISVTTVSSPFVVTSGMPVAYPVTVRNNGTSTVNHITVTAQLDAAFDYLFATPSAACSQDVPVCDFDQIGGGSATPEVIFYFKAPTVTTGESSYVFKAEAELGEGGNDNANAAHDDTFFSPSITTTVRAVSPDFVSAHSVPGIRSFTTGGIDCALLGQPANCEAGTQALGVNNPHGTRVRVPINAEVKLEDLPPGSAAAACPAAIAATCFGWASSLSVAGGAPIPGGIEVTMRWDYSELPSGMTARKLRIAHLTGANTFVQVKDPCTFNGAGVPTNMPCVSVAPFKLADRDIQATFYLPSNRVTRGY